MNTSDIHAVARELSGWFQKVRELLAQMVPSLSSSEPHQEAALLGILARNAQILRGARLDPGGKLYSPLVFLLGAACSRLGLSPSVDNWHAALENVYSLRTQLREYSETAGLMGLMMGTPAQLFKEQLDQALEHSGLAGAPSVLDEENRQLALGLSINWGIRLLIAYALECEGLPAPEPPRQDLSWIAAQIEPLFASS